MAGSKETLDLLVGRLIKITTFSVVITVVLLKTFIGGANSTSTIPGQPIDVKGNARSTDPE